MFLKVLFVYVIIGLITGIIFAAALMLGEKEKEIRISSSLAAAVTIVCATTWPIFWIHFYKNRNKEYTYEHTQKIIDKLEKDIEES